MKDEELTLVRKPYLGNELRIDGYYYHMSLNSNTFDDTYCFYRDGTVVWLSGTPPGVSPFVHMEEVLNYYNGGAPVYKTDFGLFQINDSTIAINHWWPNEGYLPAYLLEGIILNDTTFLINSSTHVKTGEIREGHRVFHFQAFSPKPDSTNTYIP